MEQKTTDFGTATKRQRWALYCLTKQDFRTKVLDKEVASNLIKDLMEKKNAKPKKSANIHDELREARVEFIVGPFQLARQIPAPNNDEEDDHCGFSAQTCFHGTLLTRIWSWLVAPF